MIDCFNLFFFDCPNKPRRSAWASSTQVISPQNEVKKLAEIILDDAAIGHDFGDKIELVRCVSEKLLPNLVTGCKRVLVLIFQPVADGVFVTLVEYARDIEFRHAIRPQISSMPFHIFLDEGEKSEHVALRKEVQKRVAGDNSFRHDFTLQCPPTGPANNPFEFSLVKTTQVWQPSLNTAQPVGT